MAPTINNVILHVVNLIKIEIPNYNLFNNHMVYIH